MKLRKELEETSKKRFEWGKMNNGERALRTSQGHSKDAGVTSEYLTKVIRPGLLVRGTSLENAKSICREGINRMDRMHIHLGRMVNSRPMGIRPGSEAVIVIDGDLCVSDGIVIYESANNVVLAEGGNGKLPSCYIAQAYELANGNALYNQDEGWLGEEGGEESEDFTALSGECDVSPLTRTCVETIGGASGGGHEPTRKKWVNADPFDGNVTAEIELDSNVSMGSGENRRESLPSMSESVPSGGVWISEEIEDALGEGDEIVHSPTWWNYKFRREGLGAEEGVHMPEKRKRWKSKER